MKPVRQALLVDLVDLEQDGPIDMAPVVVAARDADVEVAVLTDEELHWLGDTDAAPDPFLDAPRLARLGEAEQSAALDAAFWIMLARGDIDRDDGRPTAYGVHAIVGDIRGDVESVAVVRSDRRDQGSHLAALYEAGPDLVLVEHVSEVGLHTFRFQSPRRAVAALVADVDPDGRARRTGPPQHAASVDELDPRPDDLARTCEASSILYHAEATQPGQAAARALTVYSGSAGVWALMGREAWEGEPGRVVWQQLDHWVLLGLLDAFLRRQPLAP